MTIANRLFSTKFGIINAVAIHGDTVLGECRENRDAEMAESSETLAAAMLHRTLFDHRPNARDCFIAPKFFVIGTTVDEDDHGTVRVLVSHATPDKFKAVALYARATVNGTAADHARMQRHTGTGETPPAHGKCWSLSGAFLDRLALMFGWGIYSRD